MTTDIQKNSHEHIERIEQYETLAPGQFWRIVKTTKQVEENSRLDEGDLLLIESVGYADDEIHTVKVRYHPTKIAGTGHTGTAFLVRHFLEAFEHVDKADAEKERQQEIDGQHKRIGELQQELTIASNNVDYLDKRVDEDIPAEQTDSEKDESQLPVRYEAMGSNVKGAIQSGKLTNLISPSLTATGITQIKSALNEHKTIAERRAKWLTSFSEKVSNEVRRLTPFFEEAAAVALASTRSIREHIKDIMNSIDSLNLYVLKDVVIDKLTSGESAPASERLTLCQRVLFADEEMAVFVDIDEDIFDIRSIGDFFTALTEHQKLVEQIFPASRCIVPMATTRRYINYTKRGYSSEHSAQLNKENKQTFLLVRDGDNVSVVLSPFEWHRNTNALFPTHDDMEEPFRGIDGSEIGYDDVRYTDSLTDFHAMKMKYHQLLILLCGLDHKEQLFGDFYDGEPSLNFISKNFQERYFRFLHDADGDGLLADGSPLQPYDDWISDLNQEARPGSRFIIEASSVISYQTMPSAYSSGLTRSPVKSFDPVDTNEGFLTITARRRAHKLMCSIPVSGYSYEGDERWFNASFNISEMMEDKFSGYLCLDRVTPEELETYLQHRPSRVRNIAGIRLIKHALAFVRSELAREQPLRDKITTDLKSAYPSVDDNELIQQQNKALAVWKCANPSKDPLTLLSNNKAYLKLCDQIGRMFTDHTFLDDILENERQQERHPVRVFVDANGNYIALSQPPANERDNRIEPFFWLTRTRYKLNKTSVTPQQSSYVTPTKAQNDGQIVYEVDNIADYEAPKHTFFIKPEEKQQLLDMDPLADIERLKATAGDDDAFFSFVTRYKARRKQMTWAANNGRIVAPNVYAIPIGVKASSFYDEKSLNTVAIYWHIDALLMILANNNAERERVVYDALTDDLANPHFTEESLDSIRKEFADQTTDELLRKRASVRGFPTDAIENNLSVDLGCMVMEREAGAYYKVVPSPDDDNKEKFWFSHENEEINKALGATPPKDYNPMTVIMSRKSSSTDSEKERYAQAFDGVHLRKADWSCDKKVLRFDSPSEMIAGMKSWSNKVNTSTDTMKYLDVTTAEESSLSGDSVPSLLEGETPVMLWRLKSHKEDIKKL